VRDLAQHRGQAPGVVEILHQEFTRRLQIDQAGQRRSVPIPIFELELHAEPTRNREQVHDGVRRAADRRVGLDRILERAARQDLRQHQILAHHLDDAAARELREPVAPRVDRRNRRIAG
jgi:hypothetical protein